jgi:SAM-dependent methyltransferase
MPAGSSREPARAILEALKLFEAERRPAEPDVGRGFLDLLGDRDPTGRRLGQRLMVSRLLPLVYQRYWRPLGTRFLMGVTGPGAEQEHRIVLEMLSISPGDRVLDVACGPGNFTRDFAQAAGDGLVVGIDASSTMLDVAVRDTDAANIAYVRGDACDQPFRDAGFDAVCCFAALYLIEEPIRALEEIVRVLAPGGRVALLSSCSRGPLPAPAVAAVVRSLSGVRMFGREELTGALSAGGLVDVEQRVTGLAQFVSGSRPLAG